MSTAFLVVILALIWAGISGNFTGLNLLFGGLIGAVAVLVLREALAGPRSSRRIRRVLSLAILFLYELMASGELEVVKDRSTTLILVASLRAAVTRRLVKRNDPASDA